MNIIQAVILGLVEGITEFLPISSTGHLILVGKFLHIGNNDFTKSFEIIIQLGAILSVFVLYARFLFYGEGKRLNIRIMSRLAVAFLPTGILGLLLYKVIKRYLLGNVSIVLWSLLIGGIILLVFEYFHHEPQEKTTLKDISYRQAFGIGVFQTLAFIPGVSRSAATIVGGMLLGLSRRTIVEFSFLLAIPTMAAATGFDLLKNASVFSRNDIGILFVGFLVSFFAALFVIKWLLKFIQNHTFRGFAIYRIILVAILFLLAIFL